MRTHSFILPSGVDCVVKEMVGKHQRILTEQKNKKIGENLKELLTDLIVSVGSRTDIDLDFVENMLVADRKKIITEVRNFSFDYDPIFKFKFEYLTTNTEGKEVKQEKEMEAEVNTIQKSEDEGGEDMIISGFTTKPNKNQWKEYADIQKDVTIFLPKSQKEVVFRMLDGKGETAGMLTRKEERSSHTRLMMRHPREFVKTDSGKTPIQLNLDKVPVKDLEYLRSAIQEHEGNVDTEFRFTHPDAENKGPGEREVVVDIIGVLAFFFPSEAL